MSELFDRFYHGIWKWIPDDEDTSWVERHAHSPHQRTETNDLVKSFLDKGVPPEDIARYAKILSYNMAFDILAYLEDPYRDNHGKLNGDLALSWRVAVLRDDQTIEEVFSIDAPLLQEYDPTGRDMEPK